MPQQQQMTLKEKVNLVYNACDVHQRAIVVPLREGMGKNFLGFRCLLAFGLMILWTALTQDSWMLYWVVIWVFCLAWRSIEANHLEVHTHSDGWCNGLGDNQRLAKGLFEPLLVGLCGLLLRAWYLENGWNPAGLPNFLLLGVFTLSFVQRANVIMYERKIDVMNDARMEQEDIARESQNRNRR